VSKGFSVHQRLQIMEMIRADASWKGNGEEEARDRGKGGEGGGGKGVSVR